MITIQQAGTDVAETGSGTIKFSVQARTTVRYVATGYGIDARLLLTTRARR